jgi:two-component system phosphate regulon sensor histidine kinase PhoR
MNQKAIWAIIGLMGAAVIGVVWLQMDLIRTSIKENEIKFDNDVYNALNEVASRLESKEQRENFNFTGNGYATHYQSETFGKIGDGASLKFDLSVKTTKISSKKEGSSRDQLLDKLMAEVTNDTYLCPRCAKTEQEDSYRRMMAYYSQIGKVIPVGERIDLEHLKTALRQELKNRGIDTDYQYGIYSHKKKSFVVLNGVYVVEDPQVREALPGYKKSIYNSRYRVDLFRDDMPSPGLLMIHFPAKTSFVWKSVWVNFLGSILFTGIILFCFGYTINVIFRQKKLSEMKTDFINNMTHEFKTPIATISLAADSITSPMISGNSDKVRRFAGIIKQENKRMNNQVEKVLQMALLDKQDFSLKLAEVNLHDIIGRAVENISLQVEKKDGQAEAFMEATNPIVEGDITHISNIINNLLDNANKYSPEKPEISVHTRNVGNGVEVIIMDKGIGMTKEAKKHIFDKFYRVHTGDLHDVKGFGLGLSYVKAMMTAHKGQIEVKSDLGKGSSFTLFFPFRVG